MASVMACDFCMFSQVGMNEQEMVWQSDAILLVDVSVEKNETRLILRKIFKGNDLQNEIGSELRVVPRALYGDDKRPVHGTE